MSQLSKEDKIQIISSHKRNLEYRKYGLELDKLQENAKATPNTDLISTFQSSIAEIEDQVAVLDQELASVNALAEEE
jgi:hypothetical protein